jgi:prefoldin subunit 5
MSQLLIALITGLGAAAVSGLAAILGAAYHHGKAAERVEAKLEALQHALALTSHTLDDIAGRLAQLEHDVILTALMTRGGVDAAGGNQRGAGVEVKPEAVQHELAQTSRILDDIAARLAQLEDDVSALQTRRMRRARERRSGQQTDDQVRPARRIPGGRQSIWNKLL